MGMIPSGLGKEVLARFNELKDDVKKPITIYTEPQKEDCPNCYHDSTGLSTNHFNSSFVSDVQIFGTTYSPQPFTRGRCPVCAGSGYIEFETSTIIHAIVRWNPPAEMERGDMVAMPAGLEGKNVCRIKAAKCYYGVVRDSVKAVINGVEGVLYLPPAIRSIADVDVLFTAFFVASEIGNSVRDG